MDQLARVLHENETTQAFRPYLNKIMSVYHDASAHVKRKITNHDLDPFADSTPLTVYAEHSVDEVPEVNADEHQEKDVAEDID